MALTRPKYSQIYDTDWKQSVELATTADVGNLVLANVQPNSIDGITVLTNYRILVKDQNSGAQNGIYLVRSAGTGSNGWWSRSLDALTSDRVTAGLSVNVISGSVNGGKEFKLTTPDPITLGTTVLTFIDPNAAAGAGGANAQVQFNDASILGGSPGFTFNKFSNVLTLSGNVVTTSGYFVGNGAFLTGIISGGGGTVNYTTSNSTPTSPQTGDFWYNSSIDVLFQYTNDGVGNVWVDIAGPSIQASGVVFDTGLSFTGNISSINGYFLGSGQFLTGLPIGYSNVNVKAYTETMGFQNYGNVNVAAYTQTQNYTNYSNVNLSAYLGGAVTIGGNLTVSGNLIVNGNVTTINANNLTINDSMIYLAEENPADTLDIGITAHVVNPSLNHVGFVRDASDGIWKLFSNVATQPGTTVDFTNAIYSNILVGNVLARTIIAESFTGNGALLTGLPAGYSNVQVATYLPTYSGVLGSGNLQVTGGGTFTGTLTIGAGGFINSGGNVISGGTMRDSKGDVRAAPINSQSISYTVLASDAGKTIVESFSSAAITFNASVLVAGDMVSVVNTSAGTITLVQGSGVTLRLAGTATTGTRTLASNGVATVICTVGGGSPTFYCSGAGLT